MQRRILFDSITILFWPFMSFRPRLRIRRAAALGLVAPPPAVAPELADAEILDSGGA